MIDIARRPILWRSAIVLAMATIGAWLLIAPATVGADDNDDNRDYAEENGDKDKDGKHRDENKDKNGDKDDKGKDKDDENDAWKVVASHLNNPRGLTVGPDGAIYVAEAGTGGDGPCVPPMEGEGPPPPEGTEEMPGEQPGAPPEAEGAGLCYGSSGAITRIWKDKATEISGGYPSLAEGDGSFATGIHDVSVGNDGTVYGVVGLGAHPGERLMLATEEARVWVFGSLVEVDPETGAWDVTKDIANYEWMENPAGGPVDSNPYSVVAKDDSRFVIDAGGNSLLQVMDDGTIETIATFPSREVERPDELPPEAFPDMIPMESVPTSVVKGPDGAWYVGELTGFPFPVGEARVYRVEEGEEPEIYAEGFTNIVDIAFDKHGDLLVLEFAKDGLLTAEASFMETGEVPLGALIRVDDEGEHNEIASGSLHLPGGVAVDEHGNIYVSNCSVCPGDSPGDGHVIKISADKAEDKDENENKEKDEGNDA